MNGPFQEYAQLDAEAIRIGVLDDDGPLVIHAFHFLSRKWVNETMQGFWSDARMSDDLAMDFFPEEEVFAKDRMVDFRGISGSVGE